MNTKLIIPSAPSLVESMRSIGYSFETALSDIIDNSIGAEAKNIYLFCEPNETPYIAILDDGKGMDASELEEAMRYGSTNPNESRNGSDLGRFGLGMKSASLSQCRELITVSKKNNQIYASSWNIDKIIKDDNWSLISFSEEEIDRIPEIDGLKSLEHGTLVVLRNFDRIQETTNNLSDTLKRMMDKAEKHIALVFHRFINEDGLKIYINDRPISKRDPFLSKNSRTQRQKEEKINIDNSIITIKPYILPYMNSLTAEDIELLGSKDSLKDEQGFYIYRNKRLIYWGKWMGIGTKEELNKLSRIQVDIPSTLDYMWNIDIKKSSVQIPQILKKQLTRAFKNNRPRSRRVYKYRGKQEKITKEENAVWIRYQTREGFRYEINHEIPQMQILRKKLSEEEIGLLNNLLKAVEDSFPVQTFYMDMAQGDLAEKSSESEEKYMEDILNMLTCGGKEMIPVIESVLEQEPYSAFPALRKRFRKEVEKII